jgi:hypothetical protein
MPKAAQPFVKMKLDSLFVAYVVLGFGVLLGVVAFLMEICSKGKSDIMYRIRSPFVLVF